MDQNQTAPLFQGWILILVIKTPAYLDTGYTCPSPSFLASDDFCHLLITFANRLDPNQDRQNVGSDLDPNRLTL